MTTVGKTQILVGPTIGGNMSWVAFEDKELRDIYQRKMHFGYHAGATVSFHVDKKFFLHTSFLYSTKGMYMKSDYDPLYEHYTRYNYIEIPITYTAEFKTTFGRNKVFNWYFGAGPNVSYWLGGKGTLSSSYLSENLVDQLVYNLVFNKSENDLQFDEVLVEDVNRLQLGLNLAAGVVFEPHRHGSFMVKLRYEIGHSFLGRGRAVFSQPFLNESMRVRNQGFRLSLSYLYDLKVSERKKGKSTIKKKDR